MALSIPSFYTLNPDIHPSLEPFFFFFGDLGCLIPCQNSTKFTVIIGIRVDFSGWPRTYENRVSFDTFDNRDATDFSFTLISKHKDYVYSPRSRTFLCGTDQNDYSEFALEWLVDELVEDGDEIVCLRVVDRDSKFNSDSSLQEGKYRVEAKNLLEHIQNKNKDDEKSISLVLEFSAGKVPETIQRMVWVIDSRGRRAR